MPGDSSAALAARHVDSAGVAARVLDRWAEGAPVIDACFEANQAVRAARGQRPVDDIAMTVFGDPLVTVVRRHSDGRENANAGN